MSSLLYNGNPLPDRLILFDGVCNLCSTSVRFVIRRDPNARFQFAALQSDVGHDLAQQYDIANLESVVLIQQGEVYQKSSAALRIARQLNGLWPLLYVFIIIPRPFRDYVYDFVGRRRYHWFGKTEACWLPGPELKRRFFE